MAKATRELALNGHVYTITQLPAMRAVKMLNRLGRVLGPALAKLAAGGGVAQLSADALAGAAEALFDRLSEDELEQIIRQLLDSATVDGAPLMPQFDLTLQGQMSDVFQLLRFALEVNYKDFLGAIVARGVALAPIAPTMAPKSSAMPTT